MSASQRILLAAVIAGVVGIGVYKFKSATGHRSETPPLAPSNTVAAAPAIKPFKPVLQLPAPKITPAPASPQPDTVNSTTTNSTLTNAIARILAGQISRLITTEQAEAYLEAKGRTAATLLAAYSASGDQKFLREAMQAFPNDPRVAFNAIVSGKLKDDELRQWADAFEKADPDNALPNYLSALAWFNARQNDKAADQLLASAGKSRFRDYSIDALADVQQAYLTAGYSQAEAMVMSSLGLPLPVLMNLKQVGQDIGSLADGYQQAGDTASAQSARLLAANLGQCYSDSSNLVIQRLVGWAIETKALKALPPDLPYGDTGQTVQDSLDQINREKNSIKVYTKQMSDAMQSMPQWSDQDLINYFTVLQKNGELAAVEWLQKRNASH